MTALSIPDVLKGLAMGSAVLASLGDCDDLAETVGAAIRLIDGSDWWQPLYTAPRDGTWVLVAFDAPEGTYVAKARWIVPPADAPLSRRKRERVEVYGGYWSRVNGGAPSKVPALAWMPVPEPPPPRSTPERAERDYRAGDTLSLVASHEC